MGRTSTPELVDVADRTRAQRVLAAMRAELEKRNEQAVHMKRIADDADAVREECKTFKGFVKNAWHVIEPGKAYSPNWHIDAIGEHLQAVHDKQIQRLAINLPPGMMKSVTISVMFPAWEWGPLESAWLRYFTTSYEAGYAKRDSRRHRDLVLSEWYQSLWPQITLIKATEDRFENTMKGNRWAVPFRRLTAGRGNRLIIDDPHSTEGVESVLEREKTTRLFRESASSRLNDQENDAIIVVMQRLHPDDLCGVIDQYQLPYVKLVLPMEYNRSLSVKTPWFEDPRTEEGELLHPKYLGREKVEELKLSVMPHGYATQYQQMAKARDGAFFFSRANVLRGEGDNLVAVPMPTKCDGILAIMDTATKTGKKRDGTGTGWFSFSQHPKPFGLVLDWDLRQMNAELLINWLPEVMRRGEELAKECGARSGFLGVAIEDKDSGQILLQQALSKKMRASPISGVYTAMGKEGRAVACSGYVSQGMLKFTERAFDKTQEYKGRVANHMLSQVTEFRVGKGTPLDEDELFDIFTYAALLMFGNSKDAKAKK